MGISDREYYRRATAGSGWLSGVAPTCKTLILLNVAAFFLQNLLDPQFVFSKEWLFASPSGLFQHGRVWQLITATFLHQGAFHILWNMVFLWIAGRELESLYGGRDFLFLYLSAAAVSTLGWAVSDSFADRLHQGQMLGASGAVMALVVLYALYNPRRQIVFMFVITLEIWVLVVIYLAYQALLFMQPGAESKIAVASHLTGAAYGYLFKRFDLRWSQVAWPWRRSRRPRLRIVMPESPRERSAPRPAPGPGPGSGPSWTSNPPSVAKPAPTVVVPEEQLDEKLDEVLAKIAREGKEALGSLSEEEQRVLQEASRRARNRRSDRP